MNKKLFLLDGMALIYRAYFAFIRSPMINSNGVETSGVFGFMNTLLEIIQKQEPTHLAVALDVSGPTFRHEMFEEYKAHRDEMPDGIRTAIPIICEILEAMNIPVITRQGYEADDIIGTLARQAEKDGFDTYMVTGDKDYAQLVDEHTFFYKPGSKGSGVTILDEAAILEEWEIERVDQVIDILGLAGDTADNIPGIPGIGPKTAKKLIAQFGSIENLLEHTDQLKGKQKENVEANKTTALLCKKLVTIHCDVPINEKPADLVCKEPEAEKLQALLQQYELSAIQRRLFGTAPTVAPKQTVKKKTGPVQGDLFSFDAAPEAEEEEEVAAPAFKTINDVKHTYTLIESIEEIGAVVETLKKCEVFCFDTETTSLDPKEAELVGISFAIEEHEAWFIHFPGDDTEARLNMLRPLFENARQAKIGHNLKYDINVLKWQGVEVRGQLLDTMLAHYLIDPDQRHNMDHLAEAELGYQTVHITELIGEKKGQQLSMRDVPIKQLTEYAAEDADITLQLWHKLEPQLKKLNQEKVFYEIESPLVHVLSEMESAGVMINTETLENYSIVLTEKIAELETEIFTMAGAEFNMNSPKQLGEILFDVLKLVEKPKTTKTGQYATSEQVLTDLASEHDIVQKVLDYRGLTKLKNTYVDALPNSISPKTGRIHTNFAQAVTTTGRLSSTDPNLQNIPIRTPEGQEIRRAFTAPLSGKVRILACDYSQVELRLMAELSGDENMRAAFIHGEDIHTATAARVYGVELDEVTKEMRRKAKMVNFGIIYGISAFGLSQRLKIPRKEAADMIEQYFKQYPGVKKYMDNTIQFARDNGYVETVTGRRRYIRDINVKNGTVRQAAERNAINAPLQGTAADMIKIAMINIQQMLEEWHTKTRMVLQVHDELIFELHMDEADELIPRIEQLMRNAIPMTIPLLVESGTGSNWLEAH